MNNSHRDPIGTEDGTTAQALCPESEVDSAVAVLACSMAMDMLQRARPARAQEFLHLASTFAEKAGLAQDIEPAEAKSRENDVPAMIALAKQLSMDAVRAGDHPIAVSLAERALKIVDEHAPAEAAPAIVSTLVQAGICLFHSQRSPDATRVFIRAVRCADLIPDHSARMSSLVLSLANLASATAKLGGGEIERDFELCAVLQIQDPTPKVQLKTITEAAFDRVLSLALVHDNEDLPGNAARCFVGRLMASHGRNEDAICCYERVVVILEAMAPGQDGDRTKAGHLVPVLIQLKALYGVTKQTEKLALVNSRLRELEALLRNGASDGFVGPGYLQPIETIPVTRELDLAGWKAEGRSRN